MRLRFPPFTFILLFVALPPVWAVPSTTELQRTTNSDPSESKRLEAFKQLSTAGALDTQQILRSITDTSPLIRAEALRAGEPLVQKDPELEIKLLALAHDRSPLVRLQCLASFQSFPNPKVSAITTRLLGESTEDPKLPALGILASKGRLWPALEILCQDPSWKKETPVRVRFLEQAANTLRGTVEPPLLLPLLTLVADEQSLPHWSRLALLRGVLGRAKSNTTPTVVKLTETPPAIRTLLQSKDLEIQKALTAPGALLEWPPQP